MGILFGKSSKSRVTDQDKAILQLKQTRDKIKQYQKKIELNLEKDRNIAKRLLSEGKKDRAKLLLRKKKFQEQLLIRTDNQLENLEKLTHDLEFTQVEQRVIDGLKIGNEALKKAHEILNIDEIEKIMDDTREGVEKQREIDIMLSGALTSEDEEDVENEYESMIAELMPSTPRDATEESLNLPEVPSDIEEVEDSSEPKKEKSKKKVAAMEAS
ncbi:charged multivesicular body protein 6-A [Chrysoperla carnea]|uniref:charged multivesicular body protein 6-A n=1 Tax=Chrysoperla carnea TaxID=189513 RepID=UPI001D080F32|nr:charged multivesicular body protein 6-A [Chrysoperla carnea]